jgi:Ras-related protein Rab-23
MPLHHLHAGAGAAVLAFSTTDRASFDALPSWRAKVLEQCPSIAMVLVQNKVDLIEQVTLLLQRCIQCNNIVSWVSNTCMGSMAADLL